MTLIAGAMSVTPPRGMTVVEATTAAAMRQAVLRAAAGADLLVMAAAVADFAGRSGPAAGRSSVAAGTSRSDLVPNPDIIAEVGEMADGRDRS